MKRSPVGLEIGTRVNVGDQRDRLVGRGLSEFPENKISEICRVKGLRLDTYPPDSRRAISRTSEITSSR